MDKYEFNIKVEQIKKLVTKGDFTTSMKIADTIDWRRVRNANLLAMISQVYEKNGEYQEAKEILLQAYDRAPVSKRLLFKLVELALREGNVREAEEYYREFSEVAPGDVRQHLLRYLILKAKGASSRQLLPALEKYVSTELDERWMYELAELYAAVGEKALCVQMCDKITLMFAFGKYVDKALELKSQFAVLSDYQKDLVKNPDKYEAQYKAVEQEFANGGLDVFGDDESYSDGNAYSTEMQFPDREYSGESYSDGQYPADAYNGEAYADKPYVNGAYAGSYTDDSYMAAGQGEYVYPSGDSDQQAAAFEKEGEFGYNEQYEAYPAGEYVSDEVVQPSEGMNAGVEDTAGYSSGRATLDEELVANFHQAAAQEKLAREMSRITRDGVADDAALMEERTKKLYEINRALPHALRPEEKEAQVVEDEAQEDRYDQVDSSGDMAAEAESSTAEPETKAAAEQAEIPAEPVPRFMVIETRTPEKGMEKAVERLKAYHLQNNSHNQTVKIAGGKLNSRGVENVADKLAGKDLIVDEAGDLSGAELEKLDQLITADESGMVVVLLDNPRQIEEMYQKYPGQLEKFDRIDGEKTPEAAVDKTVAEEQEEKEQEEISEKEEEEPEAITEVSDQERTVVTEQTETEPERRGDDYGVEMDPDSFAQYACDYAAEIDCSITGKSMLALYERVELMEEDGVPLTKENAEAMIEEAADKAEKPSLGRMIKGIFSAKYNKEGLLILREEHFI